MKKIIKRPDGTEEVIEGTAEELAEFERRSRQGLTEVPKKGKKLLNEEKKLLADFQRMIDEAKSVPPVFIPYWQPHPYMFHSLCTGCSICQPKWDHQIVWGKESWSDQITFTGDKSTFQLVPQSVADDPEWRERMGVGPDEVCVAGVCTNGKAWNLT